MTGFDVYLSDIEIAIGHLVGAVNVDSLTPLIISNGCQVTDRETFWCPSLTVHHKKRSRKQSKLIEYASIKEEAEKCFVTLFVRSREVGERMVGAVEWEDIQVSLLWFEVHQERIYDNR